MILLLFIRIMTQCSHIVRITYIGVKAVDVLIPRNMDWFIVAYHIGFTHAVLLVTVLNMLPQQ